MRTCGKVVAFAAGSLLLAGGYLWQRRARAAKAANLRLHKMLEEKDRQLEAKDLLLQQAHAREAAVVVRQQAHEEICANTEEGLAQEVRPHSRLLCLAVNAWYVLTC